jgi:hypothetical protein
MRNKQAPPDAELVFVEDPEAPVGNVLPALACLLLALIKAESAEDTKRDRRAFTYKPDTEQS